MIPRRTALPAPKSALRDRVAIATQAGRRVEGWVVGSSCPAGAYVFDVLEDCEAAPGESRPMHPGGDAPMSRLSHAWDRAASVIEGLAAAIALALIAACALHPEHLW